MLRFLLDNDDEHRPDSEEKSKNDEGIREMKVPQDCVFSFRNPLWRYVVNLVEPDNKNEKETKEDPVERLRKNATKKRAILVCHNDAIDPKTERQENWISHGSGTPNGSRQRVTILVHVSTAQLLDGFDVSLRIVVENGRPTVPWVYAFERNSMHVSSLADRELTRCPLCGGKDLPHARDRCLMTIAADATTRAARQRLILAKQREDRAEKERQAAEAKSSEK